MGQHESQPKQSEGAPLQHTASALDEVSAPDAGLLLVAGGSGSKLQGMGVRLYLNFLPYWLALQYMLMLDSFCVPLQMARITVNIKPATASGLSLIRFCMQDAEKLVKILSKACGPGTLWDSNTVYVPPNTARQLVPGNYTFRVDPPRQGKY